MVSVHPDPPLVADPAQVAALADQQREDNAAFAYYVDIMWEREARPDAALDALVATLQDEVSAAIDCRTCGNCCRSLTVGLVPADIPRLAEGLGTSPDDVTARLVDRAAARDEDEWGVFRRSPCALFDGHLCTVYAHRPDSCRAYPALTPDFHLLMRPLMAGAAVCPIIFNVVERLKARLGWYPPPADDPDDQ